MIKDKLLINSPSVTSSQVAYATLQQHPDNPRHFLFRGHPVVLITAGEHYGAVINLDFDYRTYLDTLQDYGFKLTRIFTFFREQPTDFSGRLGHQNTLAPRPGRYLAPWRRSGIPGALDGENKFDLDQWNPDYFARLRDFCAQAGQRGIIVEMTLFGQYYHNHPFSPWHICPLNSHNNINGVGQIVWNMFTTLHEPDLVARQTALVQKIVSELNDFDNIYYEICNEPNFQMGADTTIAWHNHLIAAILETEADLSRRHLVAVNEYTPDMDPRVAVVNLHYELLATYGLPAFYHHGKIIAFDETDSTINAPDDATFVAYRRMEAWTFIFKGGAIYNFLDASFATDDPRGMGQAVFPDSKTYNGHSVRHQLGHLNQFINALDFIQLRPDNGVVTELPMGVTVFVLAQPRKTYAVYLKGEAAGQIALELPTGRYRGEWFNPRHGTLEGRMDLCSVGGSVKLTLPAYTQDLALKLTATDF